MRTRRIVLAAAAVLLAAGGGLTAVSLTRAAGAPAGCDDIRAYEQRYGEVETIGHGPRALTVLGDSYAAGDEAADRGRRWTDALAQMDPRLTVSLDAVPFTGFVNSGACGPNAFPDRVDRAARAADVLVVQGGLNDVFADRRDLERAAAEVLDAAAAAERVVVIGPVDAPAREREEDVDALLAAAAGERGMTYVSTLGWDLPFDRDGVHLTPEGNRAYAERVHAALAEAGAL